MNSCLPISFLQLFAEGSGGEGLDSGVMAKAAASQSDSGVTSENAPAAPDAGVREREFDRLIQGDYREVYQKKVQQIIQKRLRDAKDAAPVLERMAKRFGVDPGDLNALERAACGPEDGPEGMPKGGPEAGAEGAGTPENGKTPEALREEWDQRRREYVVGRQMLDWLRQAEEAEKLYPGMDFEKEARDPDFLHLLGAGVDVSSAYLVRHGEQIIPALLQCAAKSVESKLLGKLRSQGGRPPENGLKQQGAALTRPDVSKLSKEDRERIRRRAAKGERIRF